MLYTVVYRSTMQAQIWWVFFFFAQHASNPNMTATSAEVHWLCWLFYIDGTIWIPFFVFVATFGSLFPFVVHAWALMSRPYPYFLRTPPHEKEPLVFVNMIP